MSTSHIMRSEMRLTGRALDAGEREPPRRAPAQSCRPTVFVVLRLHLCTPDPRWHMGKVAVMTTSEPDDQKEERIPSGTGTAFAREGPQPPEQDTGDSVAAMNKAAKEALIRNIRPDESVD
jgi:hypothetical protein